MGIAVGRQRRVRLRIDPAERVFDGNVAAVRERIAPQFHADLSATMG
jgi:hypothetical protein